MSYAIKYAKQVEKFLDKHKDLQPIFKPIELKLCSIGANCNPY